jgi:hypothetical protein
MLPQRSWMSQAIGRIDAFLLVTKSAMKQVEWLVNFQGKTRSAQGWMLVSPQVRV